MASSASVSGRGGGFLLPPAAVA
ncbi:hypothetical protein CFC21_039757, partial [Triticum aestivum]